MESFLALLQKNVLDRRRPCPTRDQLRLAIVIWIETTYHRRRRSDTLGRLTRDVLGHASGADLKIVILSAVPDSEDDTKLRLTPLSEVADPDIRRTQPVNAEYADRSR